MVARRGEIWWASLPEPVGSEPGSRRPVLIIQADTFNRSRLSTVLCVALTTNLRHAGAPGNVYLTRRQTGLPRDSVANVSQIVAADRRFLSERVGRLSTARLAEVERGLRLIQGLD